MTDTARPIRGWTVDATCPTCGGVLGHIADGIPDPHTSRAITRCTSCGHSYAVEITLVDATTDLCTRPYHRDTCGCISCCRRRARTQPAEGVA